MGQLDSSFEVSPLRILLIEDNPSNQRVMNLIFSTVQAQLTCVDNGLEGVKAFERERFDLVLMDLMMPVMDGYAATREIRGHEARTGRARTPILVVSAKSRPCDVVESHAAGADDHMPKPVSTYALLSRVSSVLSQAQ